MPPPVVTYILPDDVVEVVTDSITNSTLPGKAGNAPSVYAWAYITFNDKEKANHKLLKCNGVTTVVVAGEQKDNVFYRVALSKSDVDMVTQPLTDAGCEVTLPEYEVDFDGYIFTVNKDKYKMIDTAKKPVIDVSVGSTTLRMDMQSMCTAAREDGQALLTHLYIQFTVSTPAGGNSIVGLIDSKSPWKLNIAIHGAALIEKITCPPLMKNAVTARLREVDHVAVVDEETLAMLRRLGVKIDDSIAPPSPSTNAIGLAFASVASSSTSVPVVPPIVVKLPKV